MIFSSIYDNSSSFSSCFIISVSSKKIFITQFTSLRPGREILAHKSQLWWLLVILLTLLLYYALLKQNFPVLDLYASDRVRHPVRNDDVLWHLVICSLLFLDFLQDARRYVVVWFRCLFSIMDFWLVILHLSDNFLLCFLKVSLTLFTIANILKELLM